MSDGLGSAESGLRDVQTRAETQRAGGHPEEGERSPISSDYSVTILLKRVSFL